MPTRQTLLLSSTIKTPLPFNLLTILVPTASGKTRRAVALALELGGEIISADSRQVLRAMVIGSDKGLTPGIYAVKGL